MICGGLLKQTWGHHRAAVGRLCCGAAPFTTNTKATAWSYGPTAGDVSVYVACKGTCWTGSSGITICRFVKLASTSAHHLNLSLGCAASDRYGQVEMCLKRNHPP